MSLKLLALETSTEACSVALLDGKQIFQRNIIMPRQHSNLILPMLEEVLNEAGIQRSQLDVLAFGCGPGSFTGIRLAASVIQAIAFALDLPVVPVSTLRALAQGAGREFSAKKVLAAIDACINEIYWGCYAVDANGVMLAQAEEKIGAPNALTAPDSDGWLGVGSGWDVHHSVLQAQMGTQLQKWLSQRYPNARDVADLAMVDYHAGKMVPAEQALPIYLRDNIAKSKIS